LATLGSASALPRAARDRPNLVMLFVDDLGYGDLGFTGHPTVSTPNIDALAFGGKVLTTWYSGCAVCSGSRAALMTGRQFARLGVPGVYGPTVNAGLPLNETTVAEQLKKANYSTAIMGKWHLGQRARYLPSSRGFDYYMGIPYSDDMGEARATSCNKDQDIPAQPDLDDTAWIRQAYEEMGFVDAAAEAQGNGDPAGSYLPLVYQEFNKTTILEQPLDFTKLAGKYNDYIQNYVEKHKEEPFFLYMPFSHVHTTAGNQPEKQYAGCDFKNTSRRGKFGDALAEVDWIIGNLIQKVRDAGIEENTLFLFTGDNGPWMIQGLSGGSHGLLSGRHSGYWNTGKGSTWEGGIREAAFAYWKGQVQPFTRSAEVVSSMDVFPTFSALAGVPLPDGVVYDGRDMSDVILNKDGKSKHDFLFHYGACQKGNAPATVRHGKWKAHWCTGPGLGGCTNCTKIYYEDDAPLLFNVEVDPSEAAPVDVKLDDEGAAALKRIVHALAMEKATFVHQKNTPLPDGPGEGPGKYGVCCDRSKNCDCDGKPSLEGTGLFGIGSKQHHDRFHEVSGEDPPLPPTPQQLAFAI
jgi:arylsulfatase A